MPRMQILTPLEQKAFDAPPEFNSEERKKYFDLPAGLLHLAQQLRTPTNQVCFLVSCGYFKATKKFYAGAFHRPDLDYVAHQLGLSTEDIHPAAYDKQTRLSAARQGGGTRNRSSSSMASNPSIDWPEGSSPGKSRRWYRPNSVPKSSSCRRSIF